MPAIGTFVLHSNFIPQLTAGEYELVSEQTGLPFDVAPEHTHVTVAAPRYTMPTDQILSTFPPANAEGAFSDRLPQIVLKRRTLPWERNPEGLVKSSATPWLALVVVAEGEAELSVTVPVADCVTPGTKLLDAVDDKDVQQGLYLAVTETVVKKLFPCKEDLDLLVHVREVDIHDTELANGDDDGWLAVVLANRLPVFDTANGKPVRYMACLLNLEGQLAALPPPEPPEDHFRFELVQDWSVLAAIDPKVGPDSRIMGGINLGDVALPGAGLLLKSAPRDGALKAPAVASKATHPSPALGRSLDGSAAMAEVPVGQQWRNATEKVSAAALDPDAKGLVRDTMASGFRYPIEKFAMEKVLRFPVLAHWSFTTTDKATFESLMKELNVSLIGTVDLHADATTGGPVPEVVQTGHVGLQHCSRRGDPMQAWYRGPCVPFPTTRDKATSGGLLPLAHAADQLRRVVPDGREDLSLASAFEIGRLLALSQLSVVSALIRFRSEQFGIGRIRELLARLSPYAIPKIVDTRVDLGRFVALQMIGDLVGNQAERLGPRRPIADPGRELKLRGELDAVIANGLGLDLAVLRKQSDQVGLLAALAKAEVPMANRSGILEIDKQAVAGLRSALNSELSQALLVAAPPLVRRTTRVGRTTAAVPLLDALDELIAQTAERSPNDKEGGE